jgi:hypothetical protein
MPPFLFLRFLKEKIVSERRKGKNNLPYGYGSVITGSNFSLKIYIKQLGWVLHMLKNLGVSKGAILRGFGQYSASVWLVSVVIK